MNFASGHEFILPLGSSRYMNKVRTDPTRWKYLALSIGSTIVAIAIWERESEDRIYLTQFAVHPDYQLQKIGKYVMKVVANELHDGDTIYWSSESTKLERCQILHQTWSETMRTHKRILRS